MFPMLSRTTQYAVRLVVQLARQHDRAMLLGGDGR